MKFARLTEYKPNVDGVEVPNKIVLINPTNVNILKKEGTDCVKIYTSGTGYLWIS